MTKGGSLVPRWLEPLYIVILTTMSPYVTNAIVRNVTNAITTCHKNISTCRRKRCKKIEIRPLIHGMQPETRKTIQKIPAREFFRVF